MTRLPSVRFLIDGNAKQIFATKDRVYLSNDR